MPLGRIRLVRHLQSVAPVTEQPGAICEDQPVAGRSCKAADKGKTLIGGRHLFSLEHVLASDEPAIKPTGGKMRAKTVDAVGSVG